MENLINLHLEALSEGGYVATSDDVQGLVAQGRTVQETIDIAKAVARRLLEAQAERHDLTALPEVGASFDDPVIIGSSSDGAFGRISRSSHVVGPICDEIRVLFDTVGDFDHDIAA
jgi:predicted RNase H-like HicB family nuclease